MNKHRIIYLLVACFMLVGFLKCDHNPPAENYNVRGTWTGVFTGEQGTSIAFSVNITGQSTDPSSGDDRLYGTWSYTGTSGYIDGETYYTFSVWGGTQYQMRLTLHSNNTTCCDVFTSCSSVPYVGIERLYLATGDINNNEIKNAPAQYKLGCLTVENGRYTLTRS